MTTAILGLLFGLFLLLLGGDSVVKGAAGLGRRMGLSTFAVGLLLVSVATSVPELAVNATALLRGSQNLALGNAIGSNVVNIGLTLAIAAMVAPLTVRWRALSPLLLCLGAATLALIALGYDGVLTRVEGIGLLVAFVAVLGFALWRGRSEDAAVRTELESFVETSPNLGLNLIRCALAAVLLYYGARQVVEHAPVIGVALGLTPLLTGLLIVAIATALPEVATAAMAARRGQGSIVAGHVIGSSLVNLLVAVGGLAAVRDLPIPASFLKLELPAAFVFLLLLAPMLRGDLRISRNEGVVLLLAFLGWVGFEIALSV
jgi:cation:H+ antiporter